MEGNNRDPFGDQCSINCGFLGCRKLGILVCINIELRMWSVESFSMTVINHLQNRYVIKYVTVKVATG